jgi:cyanate lyase
MDAPDDFGTGGATLWCEITGTHELDAAQLVQLTEACRAKDRLDKLDLVLRGDVEAWMSTQALNQANATANLMKQLLAAMRLPDEAGRKPQRRSARGVQAPSVPSGSRVSSLDRARAAAS